MDLEEPRQGIRRSKEWVFGPKESYECAGKVAPGTFPYGAAGSTVCLTVAEMDQLMDYVNSCPTPGILKTKGQEVVDREGYGRMIWTHFLQGGPHEQLQLSFRLKGFPGEG